MLYIIRYRIKSRTTPGGGDDAVKKPHTNYKFEHYDFFSVRPDKQRRVFGTFLALETTRK